VTGTLVDSNVILDVLTDDTEWGDWSAAMLAEAARSGLLAINPIIYAEVSVRFERIEDLDDALPERYYRRLPLPFEAAFLTGQCFLKYRKRGGTRTTPMPDFYIGAKDPRLSRPSPSNRCRRGGGRRARRPASAGGCSRPD